MGRSLSRECVHVWIKAQGIVWNAWVPGYARGGWGLRRRVGSGYKLGWKIRQGLGFGSFALSDLLC